MRKLVFAGAIAACLAGQTYALDKSGEAAAPDPTTPPMDFQIQDGYSPSVYSTGDTSQTFGPMRPELRFTFAGRQNIPRATLTIFTGTLGRAGRHLAADRPVQPAMAGEDDVKDGPMGGKI